MIDYSRTCFVIMPFGTKPVGKRDVHFDDIYDQVFVPAIRATPLPEGGMLEPRRTDQDFFAGDIGVEMFRYLEYSRIALADISGLNANVMYELGVRHHVRESGTAIFRQLDAPIPFDINRIKAFPYEYEPEQHAAESRALITRVLTESLTQNRMDSPVQQVLSGQQSAGPLLENLLRTAEDAVRNNDLPTAEARYTDVLAQAPGNILARMKRGLLRKDTGRWDEALADFASAIDVQPSYADAWRERGVAENKLKRGAGIPGEASLREAIRLNPNDFDAMASLGGALKRAERFADARDAYARATEASRGHSYPLLNALILDAYLTGALVSSDALRLRMARAERSLRAQVDARPPYNAPWSFFDLALVRLFSGDSASFHQSIDGGLDHSAHSWQPETFRDTLRLLSGRVAIDGVAHGLEQLTRGIALLKSAGL